MTYVSKLQSHISDKGPQPCGRTEIHFEMNNGIMKGCLLRNGLRVVDGQLCCTRSEEKAYELIINKTRAHGSMTVADAMRIFQREPELSSYLQVEESRLGLFGFLMRERHRLLVDGDEIVPCVAGRQRTNTKVSADPEIRTAHGIATILSELYQSNGDISLGELAAKLVNIPSSLRSVIANNKRKCDGKNIKEFLLTNAAHLVEMHGKNRMTIASHLQRENVFLNALKELQQSESVEQATGPEEIPLGPPFVKKKVNQNATRNPKAKGKTFKTRGASVRSSSLSSQESRHMTREKATTTRSEGRQAIYRRNQSEKNKKSVSHCEQSRATSQKTVKHRNQSSRNPPLKRQGYPQLPTSLCPNGKESDSHPRTMSSVSNENTLEPMLVWPTRGTKSYKSALTSIKLTNQQLDQTQEKAFRQLESKPLQMGNGRLTSINRRGVASAVPLVSEDSNINPFERTVRTDECKQQRQYSSDVYPGNHSKTTQKTLLPAMPSERKQGTQPYSFTYSDNSPIKTLQTRQKAVPVECNQQTQLPSNTYPDNRPKITQQTLQKAVASKCNQQTQQSSNTYPHNRSKISQQTWQKAVPVECNQQTQLPSNTYPDNRPKITQQIVQKAVASESTQQTRPPGNTYPDNLSTVTQQTRKKDVATEFKLQSQLPNKTHTDRRGKTEPHQDEKLDVETNKQLIGILEEIIDTRGNASVNINLLFMHFLQKTNPTETARSPHSRSIKDLHMFVSNCSDKFSVHGNVISKKPRQP